MNDSQNRAASLTKSAPRSSIAESHDVALLKAEQQPFALLEDDKHRIAAMAGATIAFSRADEATQALVEAALLPKGSKPPAWLDETGMKFIGILKEFADEWIKAQRTARAKKKKDQAKTRLNLRLVPGGVQ